ncbi:pimeloyl-ACP methyl ester carboxylesterase [Micromonospora olivasterospora]|uniref:Pimeloyl-ACP methyl ester carboxylesterase n=1 Tax=Micromonospora olivasterospora TaxID=1880 RepID=A0A562I5P3_MICOL|nr:pimeloyl-ACP methyl ester carboxylesterase [Micromonospora olivasterospora]
MSVLGRLAIMRVDARGLTFEVRAGGPADGEAVLLLHGFPQHGGEWDEVVPALHAAGLRTYAPDQRGYSPGARPVDVAAYRVPELVADAVALLDALGADAAHVVGHDWGAIVAWALAAGHPDRVRTLTAVSVPHPAAMAHALATSAEQKARSSYIALFRRPGTAEKALLALDAAALRRMLGGVGGADRVARYAEPMREPGALTAALNWYRAMSRPTSWRSRRCRCRRRTSGATGTSRSAGPRPRRAPPTSPGTTASSSCPGCRTGSPTSLPARWPRRSSPGWERPGERQRGGDLAAGRPAAADRRRDA